MVKSAFTLIFAFIISGNSVENDDLEMIEDHDAHAICVCPIVDDDAGCEIWTFNTYSCGSYSWTVSGDAELEGGGTTSTSSTITLRPLGSEGSFNIDVHATSCNWWCTSTISCDKDYAFGNCI